LSRLVKRVGDGDRAKAGQTHKVDRTKESQAAPSESHTDSPDVTDLRITFSLRAKRSVAG
jgi:hypothetical protein